MIIWDSRGKAQVGRESHQGRGLEYMLLRSGTLTVPRNKGPKSKEENPALGTGWAVTLTCEDSREPQGRLLSGLTVYFR